MHMCCASYVLSSGSSGGEGETVQDHREMAAHLRLWIQTSPVDYEKVTSSVLAPISTSMEHRVWPEDTEHLGNDVIDW